MLGAENSGSVVFPAGQARYVLFSNVPDAPLDDARIYFAAPGAIRAYDSCVVSDLDSCVGHFSTPSRQSWKRLSLPFFHYTVILSISRPFLTRAGCFCYDQWCLSESFRKKLLPEALYWAANNTTSYARTFLYTYLMPKRDGKLLDFLAFFSRCPPSSPNPSSGFAVFRFHYEYCRDNF